MVRYLFLQEESASENMNPTGKKIPYDSITMNAVTVELNQLLIGGQIQDVRQPFPHQLVLTIRNRDKTNHLLIDTSAQFARVHLTSTKRSNAPVPSAFCTAVRRHMENRRITSISQLGLDRILHITAAGLDEAPTTLIAEIMGKHSNVVLTDCDGRIIDAAHRVTHRINRHREILPGGKYMPPPAQDDRVSPFVSGSDRHILRELAESHLTSLAEISSALQQIYEGMSPFLANEIAARGLAAADVVQGVGNAWNAIFRPASAGTYKSVIYRDSDGLALGAYPFASIQLAETTGEPAGSINLALDECWSLAAQRSHLQGLRLSLTSELHNALRHIKQQLEACNRGLVEAGQAEALRQRAELIKANLWRAEPGMTSMTVEDYWDPELKAVEIKFGAGRSALEEAEHLFARSRKAKASLERESDRKKHLTTQLNAIQRATAELQLLATEHAIAELRTELKAAGLLPREAVRENVKPGESEWAGFKIRRYYSPEGFEILVGETSTSNDYLTTRVAHTNDIWLHVRAAPSAHTVIRTHGKPDQVPRTVLEYAAQICALHSANKHSSLVSVDYTLKRYVRKPRGSAPGAADYTKEVTIDVAPGLAD